LYERGLRVVAHSSGKEARKLAAEFWQEAWTLYRKADNLEKAGEVQAQLLNLYKKKSAKVIAEKAPRVNIVSKFNDWMLFFKIGCFGFGGPLAVFSLLEDELVRRKKILTTKDFLEGAVLGDILPGPVTMDIVTYTGFKLATWRGALIATLAFILPSFIIMLILAIYYDVYHEIPKVAVLFKCLGAAVTGLILSVGFRLCQSEMKGVREMWVLLFAFVSSLVFKIDMVIIVVLAGIIGIIVYQNDEAAGDLFREGK